MRKASRADVLTPANAITTAGLLLTAAGALILNTPLGFWLVIIGKFMDVIDGQVARRTHTSNFGADYDAIADKITVLILVLSTFYYHLVPLPFLIFLVIYHGIIAVIGLDALFHSIDADPSRLGKYTMTLHMLAIGLFIFDGVFHFAHQAVFILAIAVALTGVSTGIICLTRYIREYIDRVYKPFHTKH
ncbi:MAG TPA: CDP-alcohol phosphatidyltransferase family protein [Candidatus Saccharimonadales bacterium]|nr:CDP-alcohol phosphatidyltransferase family protein [Candidatus Saccharimonadales bacterium]